MFKWMIHHCNRKTSGNTRNINVVLASGSFVLFYLPLQQRKLFPLIIYMLNRKHMKWHNWKQVNPEDLELLWPQWLFTIGVILIFSVKALNKVKILKWIRVCLLEQKWITAAFHSLISTYELCENLLFHCGMTVKALHCAAAIYPSSLDQAVSFNLTQRTDIRKQSTSTRLISHMHYISLSIMGSAVCFSYELSLVLHISLMVFWLHSIPKCVLHRHSYLHQVWPVTSTQREEDEFVTPANLHYIILHLSWNSEIQD